MDPAYTVTTRTSWGGNIKGAFTAALIGLLLFFGAFALLSWNEGNSVKTHAALNWAEAGMATAAPSPLDRGLEGRVIYLTGPAQTRETLRDDTFPVARDNALRLRRLVEMYQWKEESHSTTHDRIGGGSETVTEYRYHKTWSDTPIDSARFHVPGHSNPSMPLRSRTSNARQALLGDYQMTDTVLDKLDGFDDALSPPAVQGYRQDGQTLYRGSDPATPQVGDLRITFSAVPAGPVSLVGLQSGQQIKPAHAPSDRNVLLVEAGTVPATDLFSHAHDAATLLTWVLRAAGFLLMWVGLSAILSPLKALAKVLPPLGWLVGFGIGAVSFIVALILSAGTIAIAWFAYRPALSGLLLAGALGLSAVVWFLRRPKARLVGVAPAAPQGV